MKKNLEFKMYFQSSEANKAIIHTDDYLIYNYDKTVIIGCTSKCFEEETIISVPKNVHYIYSHAFANSKIISFNAQKCHFLIIGESCFENCKELKRVLLPNYGQIKINAFKGCDNINYLALPIYISMSCIAKPIFWFQEWSTRQCMESYSQIKYPIQRIDLADRIADENGLLFSSAYIDSHFDYKFVNNNKCIISQFYKERLAFKKLTGRFKITKKTKLSFSTHTKFPSEVPTGAFVNVLVYSTTKFKCRTKEHQIVDVNIIVPIITPKGETLDYRVSGGYCPHCGTYFIATPDYHNLKSHGRIACRVLEYTHYYNYESNQPLQDESILKQYGYSVSQKAALSARTRQEILKTLIEDGQLSNIQIRNLLGWFIRYNGNKPNMTLAVSKWKEDLNFIQHYYLKMRPEVKAISIKHIHYEPK